MKLENIISSNGTVKRSAIELKSKSGISALLPAVIYWKTGKRYSREGNTERSALASGGEHRQAVCSFNRTVEI
jgi:hypothetical protein